MKISPSSGRPRRPQAARALAVSLLATVLACSAADRSTSAPGAKGEGAPAPATTGEVVSPDAIVGTLHGKVLAPEGTIPVGGALVALLDKEPEALPSWDVASQSLPTALPFALTSVEPSRPPPMATESALSARPCNKDRTPGHQNTGVLCDRLCARESRTNDRREDPASGSPAPAKPATGSRDACPSGRSPATPVSRQANRSSPNRPDRKSVV